MKRNGILFVIVLMIFSVIPVSAGQADVTATAVTSLDEEVFDDGSYIITEITESETPVTYSTTKTKSGTKKSTYYNSNGTLAWSLTVSGTFQYTGTTSKATSASSTVVVNSSSWSFSNKTASYSSNKAIASATFKQKTLGITINTINRSVTISCSASDCVNSFV